MSPRLAGWAGSPLILTTAPPSVPTRSPQPTPQYGQTVRDHSGMGTLLEEAEHGVAQPEIVGVGEDVLALPGTQERHLENLPDGGGGPACHHHDAIGEQ